MRLFPICQEISYEQRVENLPKIAPQWQLMSWPQYLTAYHDRIALALIKKHCLTSSLTKWQRDSPMGVGIFRKSMMGFVLKVYGTIIIFEIFSDLKWILKMTSKFVFSQFANYMNVWQVQIVGIFGYPVFFCNFSSNSAVFVIRTYQFIFKKK